MLAAKGHDKAAVIPRLVIADISEPGSAGATIEALRAAYSAPILALSARFRRGLAGTTETSPETGRQREDGRRIRGPQCLNRSACAARFGNVRNHEPGYDRGFVMAFRGQHDALPGFAEPAP